MGFAMTELSSRWKGMSYDDREPWILKEKKDRKRFKQESSRADMRAVAEQRDRRNNLVAKYQISDDLIREDERLDDLDEQFRVDINWEQKKKWFGFIN